jgi:hypothetical protein
VPLYQYLQYQQYPLYYNDGYYCEIQYVSPLIVSKSDSSHASSKSSPVSQLSQLSQLATSQPPQTSQDTQTLEVSM